MKRVAIVGAGISGLAIAYRLQESCPAISITVLEKQGRPGGAVWTERQDDFQVEVGPNGFLDSKPSTLNLCRALGIEDRLVLASEASGRNRYLWWNEKLEPLPRNLRSFLATPLLSWRGKLRLLSERFVRRSAMDADESIDAFVQRRAGREAAEVLADALVTGIYAGDPEVLSLRACFPRLAAMEQEYGSVLRGMAHASHQRRAANTSGEARTAGGRMWSFPEGLRLLIETLRDKLNSPPICDVQVDRLELSSDEGQPAWIVHGNDQWPADAVVVTCPAFQQAAIVRDLDAELAKRIETIAYNHVTVVALGFRQGDIPRPLDGFGFIAPQRTRRDILGVQWCSSIFPQRAPQGMVLLRAMCGGWNRPDIASWDDECLVQAVRAELRLSMGISAAPVFQRIIRWDRAIPQYRLGHLENVRWLEERSQRYPGLFLAGNCYHGVALNDCTEQAEKISEQVASFLLRNE
jgi:protoporphyrinogen/coproporphyrinogen III oxidase